MNVLVFSQDVENAKTAVNKNTGSGKVYDIQ
jgi:hypothetical protein